MPETTYQIYYSSRSKPDGKMWCPDYVAVAAPLENIFNQPNGPRAEIIYVGDRPTWKDSNYIFKQEPLKLTSIPTVVKFVDGKVVERIEEEGILDAEKMSAFMKS